MKIWNFKSKKYIKIMSLSIIGGLILSACAHAANPKSGTEPVQKSTVAFKALQNLESLLTQSKQAGVNNDLQTQNSLNKQIPQALTTFTQTATLNVKDLNQTPAQWMASAPKELSSLVTFLDLNSSSYNNLLEFKVPKETLLADNLNGAVSVEVQTVLKSNPQLASAPVKLSSPKAAFKSGTNQNISLQEYTKRLSLNLSPLSFVNTKNPPLASEWFKNHQSHFSSEISNRFYPELAKNYDLKVNSSTSFANDSQGTVTLNVQVQNSTAKNHTENTVLNGKFQPFDFNSLAPWVLNKNENQTANFQSNAVGNLVADETALAALKTKPEDLKTKSLNTTGFWKSQIQLMHKNSDNQYSLLDAKSSKFHNYNYTLTYTNFTYDKTASSLKIDYTLTMNNVVAGTSNNPTATTNFTRTSSLSLKFPTQAQYDNNQTQFLYLDQDPLSILRRLEINPSLIDTDKQESTKRPFNNLVASKWFSVVPNPGLIPSMISDPYNNEMFHKNFQVKVNHQRSFANDVSGLVTINFDFFRKNQTTSLSNKSLQYNGRNQKPYPNEQFLQMTVNSFQYAMQTKGKDGKWILNTGKRYNFSQQQISNWTSNPNSILSDLASVNGLNNERLGIVVLGSGGIFKTYLPDDFDQNTIQITVSSVTKNDTMNTLLVKYVVKFNNIANGNTSNINAKISSTSVAQTTTIILARPTA